MSERTNSLNTNEKDTKVVDEVGTSLFYRMTHCTDDTNVPIDNINEANISVVGDTYEMYADVVQETTTPINKYAFVYGNDLLSKISTLSFAIEYDQEYRGEYIQLYNLLESIVAKLP